MLLCICIVLVIIRPRSLLFSNGRESNNILLRTRATQNLRICGSSYFLLFIGLCLHAQFHFCFTRAPQRSLMPSLSNSAIPRMSFPLMRINTFPSRFLNAHSTSPEEIYATPNGDVMFEPNFLRKNKVANTNGIASPDVEQNNTDNLDVTEYHTPKAYHSQISNNSSSSADEYKTPDCTLTKKELFSDVVELRKSCSSSVVDQRVKSMSTIKEHIVNNRSSDSSEDSCEEKNNNLRADHLTNGVLRSKSDFEIPRVNPTTKSESVFQKISQKSDSLLAFLTPHLKRKNSSDIGKQSTPNKSSPPDSLFRIPGSPIHKHSLRSLPETRTTSLNSLRSGCSGTDAQQLGAHQVQR